jgi:hypothetical protein
MCARIYKNVIQALLYAFNILPVGLCVDAASPVPHFLLLTPAAEKLRALILEFCATSSRVCLKLKFLDVNMKGISCHIPK